MSQIYLDSGKLELYRKFQEIMPLAGVTSNPSILAKEYADQPFSLYDFIKETLPVVQQLDHVMHIQCVGKTSVEFIKSAKEIISVVDVLKLKSKHVVIKVPGGSEGLKSIQELSKNKIQTTATGLYRAMQCIYAAEAGADFVVLYVNRMETEEIDVRFELESLRNYLDRHHLKSKILAASFKRIDQITSAFAYGADYCTIQPEILLDTINTPLTERDNTKFYQDSQQLRLC